MGVEAAKQEIDPSAQVARALLLAKANPFAITTKGDTPLHYAAACGSQSLYDCLLCCVAERAGEEAAEKLAKTTNEFGQTPRDCLGRTLTRNEHKEKQASIQDDKALMSLGFFGFLHCVQEAHVEKLIETHASSMLDM